jgi:hypothetical protein
MGSVVIGGKVMWDGTHGGKLGIWKAKVDIAKAIIAKYQLQPIGVNTQITGGLKSARSVAAKSPVRWPKVPFPGVPDPHLHYGGKIYPVSEVQWRQFADGVMKDVQAKLAKSSQVGPIELEVLSEMTANLK